MWTCQSNAIERRSTTTSAILCNKNATGFIFFLRLICCSSSFRFFSSFLFFNLFFFLENYILFPMINLDIITYSNKRLIIFKHRQELFFIKDAFSRFPCCSLSMENFIISFIGIQRPSCAFILKPE